jgi:hypothetical protein
MFLFGNEKFCAREFNNGASFNSSLIRMSDFFRKVSPYYRPRKPLGRIEV